MPSDEVGAAIILDPERFSMRFDWTRAAALAATFLVTTWGCSSATERPETVPVQGKVTYKGEPVPKGTVTFLSDGGQVATGEIQPDGSYKLSTFEEGDGAIPGPAKVGILANTLHPHMMPGSSPGYKPPKDLVPKKYSKPESSGLEATVTKDGPPINFDLK